MGETGAAVTMATILQRTEDGIIRNPGGYLRTLVVEAIRREILPGADCCLSVEGASKSPVACAIGTELRVKGA